MSPGKIKRTITKLEETGWIKTEEHFKREGQGNVYILSSPFVRFSQNGNNVKSDSRFSQNGHHDSTVLDNTILPKREKNKEELNKEKFNKQNVNLLSSYSENKKEALIKWVLSEGARNPHRYIEGALQKVLKPDWKSLLGPDHPEVRSG